MSIHIKAYKPCDGVFQATLETGRLSLATLNLTPGKNVYASQPSILRLEKTCTTSAS